MIRPGDIMIALAGIAMVAALATNLYSGSKAHTVRIAQGSHEHADYPAWQNRRVTIAGPRGDTIVEIHDGRVRILESPCMQKICIRAGWLDAAGEAAACVPNRVSVALLGDDPRFDAINF